MAIDTKNKKLSVMEMEDIWEPSIPISSPLTQADFQQLIWGYAGILWHSLLGSQGSPTYSNLLLLGVG